MCGAYCAPALISLLRLQLLCVHFDIVFPAIFSNKKRLVSKVGSMKEPYSTYIALTIAKWNILILAEVDTCLLTHDMVVRLP